MHTIRKRQEHPGVITLLDLDPHWWYDRSNQPLIEPQRRILLNPAKVKGKGRPKGAKGKQKGDGESSTRRDPSLFEREAVELPSSTAPARLESAKKGKKTIKKEILTTTALKTELTVHATIIQPPEPLPKSDISMGSGLEEMSTTVIGLQRGGGTERDQYEPGTTRERAYMRTIQIDKLGSVRWLRKWILLLLLSISSRSVTREA